MRVRQINSRSASPTMIRCAVSLMIYPNFIEAVNGLRRLCAVIATSFETSSCLKPFLRIATLELASYRRI